MIGLETIFILMFAGILLVGIAQKFHIPYPIALVVGGTALGFIPGLQAIYFNPDLILVIVLPPILYYGAFGISFYEFTRNWKDIFSLALTLVVITTLVIAVIFKWLFPQFSWALAFAFGAIISPPDAIAATSILRRFDLNSRLVTLLEGESLINDASAIVLYKLAVTALLSGTFSALEAGIDFFQMVIGGIAVGFILGFLTQLFSRRYLEPVLGVVFSFTIPYISYIIANFMGVSGVLAVVVNGLIGSRMLLIHHSSLRRVLGYATWDVFVILLNCFVFILIGLQLRAITKTLTIEQIVLYTGYALLITFSMIVVRMIWVYAKVYIAYFRTLKDSKISPKALSETALIGWSGMRGIVSLAAAIALPVTLPNGLPLQGRNEVIFITFLVILITLIIPGLSLPSFIRWLKIQRPSQYEITKKIRNQLAKVAEEKLLHLFTSNHIDETEYDFLKAYFIAQSRVYEMYDEDEYQLQNIQSARLVVIKEQRGLLLTIGQQEDIDDKLLSHLIHELDLAEIHIARAEL